MSDKKTVFVTGATGNQGGAVADALLTRGHTVVFLTRNPDSDRAKSLQERSARAVTGDFSDANTLVSAAKGADAAYAMTTPFEAGIEAEVAQGKSLVNALKQAGVGHVVFSSVSDADKATGIPHFDSKYEVEKHLASLDAPYSVVGPVYFMDNLLTPWSLPTLKEGKLAMALPAERPLQQVAVGDIGAFAAALIERGEGVYGKRYDIAGDELTGTQAAAVVSKASGRDIRFEGFPADALRADSEDTALMFEWFDRTGYTADIAALRQDFSEVLWLTFEDWAAKQDWSVLN